jgi:hypothetical protein
MKSNAPCFSAATAMAMSPCPVIRITGSSGSRARTALKSAWPSKRGMRRSVTTTAGSSCGDWPENRLSSADWPSPKLSISSPAMEKLSASAVRNGRSSSTRRMRIAASVVMRTSC